MPASPLPSGDDASSRTHQRHVQGRVGLQKVNVACDRCRVKKIKCKSHCSSLPFFTCSRFVVDLIVGDGTTPCQSCRTVGVDCKYSRAIRRYRGASIAKTQNLQQRLSNAKRLLQSAGLVGQQETSSPIEEPNEREIITASQPVICVHDDVAAETSFHATSTRHDNVSISGTSHLVDPPSTEVEPQHTVESEDVGYLPDDNVPLPDASGPPSGDGPHGPNSYASICADSGVAWIASHISASNYATCATSFMSSNGRKLKLQKRLSRHRLPDPPIETTWRYTMGKPPLSL
jgi:hypothetical protein